MSRAALYTNNRFVSCLLGNRRTHDSEMRLTLHCREMFGLFLLARCFVAYREYLTEERALQILTELDSAGLFWASEGAVALGYPEPTKRGRYMK